MYRKISSDLNTAKLQDDLNNAANWEATSFMKFNPDKCKVMHVARSPSLVLSQYILHETVLETIDSSKYLRVTLSSDLSFNQYIDISIKKASDRLRFIKRNLYSASKDTKSVAYFALVRPIVEYASIIWDPY